MMPLRRFLASRRGDWIQLLMVFFFILVLILSVALLTLDLDKLKSDRQQLGTDLLDQEANTQLINILRYQAEDGAKHSSLASVVTMNDGSDDELIRKTVEEAMPKGYYFELNILTPDGSEVRVMNAEFTVANKNLLRTKGPAGLESEIKTAQSRPTDGTNFKTVPRSRATTYLPGAAGNIEAELFLSPKGAEDAPVSVSRPSGISQSIENLLSGGAR